LALNDLNVVLTEEVLNQLAVEDALASDFCQLSLNALAGTDQGQAMKLRALVQNKVLLILVDGGSSHSFVSKAIVQMLGISTVPMSPYQVRLANGDCVITGEWVPNFEWWCNGHTITTAMKVLDMPAYDAILGYDWLQQNSPMTCDWAAKTLQFQSKGKSLLLQGVQSPAATIQEMSIQQVRKWATGNDIWAIAVVEAIPEPPPIAHQTAVQQVLQQYQDVFQDPQQLPPSRFYDHHIPLLPGAAPINARPYKYPPHHKDEIEKQVQQLLTAGLITRSCSPFASPVLLVLKKDGS
jgi:hypothetical protein